MIISPSLNGKANLIAMLNSKARLLGYDPADLTFGTPVAQVPGAGNDNSNTQITATAVANNKHFGAGTFNYNRLPLVDNRPFLNGVTIPMEPPVPCGKKSIALLDRSIVVPNWKNS